MSMARAVYHGELSKLPRTMCHATVLPARHGGLLGKCAGGEPFCYFNQAVDHGLVQAMRENCALAEATSSVSAKQNSAWPPTQRVPRFTVIFDREGYSPACFGTAAATDRGADLPIAIRTGGLACEGVPGTSREAGECQTVRMKLASGARMWQAARACGFEKCANWVQTAIRCRREHEFLGGGGCASGRSDGALVARKLLQVHGEHFGLDALVQYGTEEIPATVTVLNPRGES